MTTGATWRLLQNIWPWILEINNPNGAIHWQGNSNPHHLNDECGGLLSHPLGFQRLQTTSQAPQLERRNFSLRIRLVTPDGLCLKPWVFPVSLRFLLKRRYPSMEMCRINQESSFFKKTTHFAVPKSWTFIDCSSTVLSKHIIYHSFIYISNKM